MDSPAIRRLYVHNQLLAAAQSMLKQSVAVDQFSNSMGCIVFCALAVEASLNHVGAESFPNWQEHLKRKLTPERKLSLIASKAHRGIDFSQKPFQAFQTLFQIRNVLAHGTTQDLDSDSAEYWIEYERVRWPAAKWELLCNTANASSLLQDTQSIVKELFIMSGVEEIPRFLLSEHVQRDA
jgi:hypothetical protein